jgi:quercetin dioxygenase-like cupin family protein
MNYGPFLKGLPANACQCPHWGYCFKGKLIVRYTEGHEETVTAGEAYYMPPGHVPEFLEDTETLEFSPKAELDRTMSIVKKNMSAMGG